MGRCRNDTLREHSNKLQCSPFSHLACDCIGCCCKPVYEDTLVFDKFPDQVSREILEAYQIASLGNNCIRAPSIDLHTNELCFLHARLGLSMGRICDVTLLLSCVVRRCPCWVYIFVCVSYNKFYVASSALRLSVSFNLVPIFCAVYEPTLIQICSYVGTFLNLQKQLNIMWKFIEFTITPSYYQLHPYYTSNYQTLAKAWWFF